MSNADEIERLNAKLDQRYREGFSAGFQKATGRKPRLEEFRNHPDYTATAGDQFADEIERLNGIIRAARDRFATSDEGEEVGDAMDTILMEADA